MPKIEPKAEPPKIQPPKVVEQPKVEPPKVVEQPKPEPLKPATQNPFVKNAAGEILSSKKAEPAPVETKQEEKKVFGDPAPKKLMISDVFKQ